MKQIKKLYMKKNLLKPLIAIYFLIAFIEIIAEYYRDFFYISISKPLLMPILIGIYTCSSKEISKIFILSLIAVWCANLFLIPATASFINIGTLFFLIYRMLIILMIIRVTKFPGYVPFILGCIPFLLIYLFVTNIAHNEPATSFSLFIMQGIFMILFGGYCLGNYIVKSNTSNMYLLISTVFLTAVQCILVVKVFYEQINIFRPMSMLLFVCAQYLLCKFIVLEEKKKKRYVILNKKINGVNNPPQNDFQHT